MHPPMVASAAIMQEAILYSGLQSGLLDRRSAQPNPSLSTVPDTKHSIGSIGRADVTVRHLTVPPVSCTG